MDEPSDYRPAAPRDFKQAIRGVDAGDLRPEPAVTTSEYASVSERPVVAPAVVERRVDDTAPPTRERIVTTDAPLARRPFSIAAGFFGWAVASFFTLVLSTIVLAFIGASAYDITDAGANGLDASTFNDLTTTGLIGLVIALFLAYALGGYAAGRIGLWHGVGHGVAVVAWSVLFSVIAVALALTLGDSVDALNLVPRVDWNDLTTPTLVGLLVALVTMLLGAILGAKLGTRTDTAEDALERRRVGRSRGRPF